jgi:hypothetical protein
MSEQKRMKRSGWRSDPSDFKPERHRPPPPDSQVKVDDPVLLSNIIGVLQELKPLFGEMQCRLVQPTFIIFTIEETFRSVSLSTVLAINCFKTVCESFCELIRSLSIGSIMAELHEDLRELSLMLLREKLPTVWQSMTDFMENLKLVPTRISAIEHFEPIRAGVG